MYTAHTPEWDQWNSFYTEAAAWKWIEKQGWPPEWNVVKD